MSGHWKILEFCDRSTAVRELMCCETESPLTSANMVGREKVASPRKSVQYFNWMTNSVEINFKNHEQLTWGSWCLFCSVRDCLTNWGEHLMGLMFRIRSHQRRQEGCSDSTVPESPDIKQIFSHLCWEPVCSSAWYLLDSNSILKSIIQWG